MIFLLYYTISVIMITLVESRGEKYDLEVFNLMQILRPLGSNFINGTLYNNPTLFDGEIHVSKDYYPHLFFLHAHIPKTGGTTFKDLVKVIDPKGIDKLANCGYTYVGHKTSAGGIASKSAKSIVEVVNSGCTYYSHETNYRDYRFILNGNNGTAPYKFIRVFTIIRQPLDHAFSALGHYARYHAMGMTNRCPGLHAYLGGRCDMYDLHNLQTTRLSNGNLTEAIDIIDRMFWVGITEYFDASICLLAYQLGQFSFKLCDCALKPKNVVEHKNVAQTELTSTQTDIVKLNSMLIVDQLLYTHALSVFMKRIDTVERVMGIKLICNDVDHKKALTKFDYKASEYNLKLNKEHIE